MKDGQFDKDLYDWARAYLSDVLARCDNNVSKAARFCGRNRTDFYKMLRRYDVIVRHKEPVRAQYDMSAFLGGKKREAKPAYVPAPRIVPIKLVPEPCACSACMMAAPWLCEKKAC